MSAACLQVGPGGNPELGASPISSAPKWIWRLRLLRAGDESGVGILQTPTSARSDASAPRGHPNPHVEHCAVGCPTRDTRRPKTSARISPPCLFFTRKCQQFARPTARFPAPFHKGEESKGNAKRNPLPAQDKVTGGLTAVWACIIYTIRSPESRRGNTTEKKQSRPPPGIWGRYHVTGVRLPGRRLPIPANAGEEPVRF